MAGGGGTARLMGFGFLFGARDAGAVATMDRVKDKAKDVGDEFEETKGKTTDFGSSFDRMVRGLQLHRLNEISSSLQGIAQRAGSLSEVPAAFQATGIENFGVSFSNTYRRTTAGLGEFRGQVDAVRGQISSLAYSLDVSAEEMLATNIATARAGHSLDAYGVSQRGLAGLISGGLVQGEQFGNMLVSWSDGYGLGTERAGALADTMVALGERAGDVGAVMQGLPGIMSAIDTAGAEFPVIAENMDTFAQSTVRLAVAMQRRGLGPLSTTMEQATSVFTGLAAQRGNLSNLFTGLGSDFGGLATELSVATGDVGGAVEAAMQDPIRFAGALNHMVEGMDPTRAQRLRREITEMSPQLAFLANGSEDAAALLAEMQQPMENVAGAVNRVGEAAAHTSRTLADSMERQQDAFQLRYRRMIRDSVGGAGNILAVQRRAFGTTISTLESWSSGNGPLGQFGARATQTFFRAQTGIYGVVASLQAIGGPLLETAAQLAPVVSLMASLAGPVISSLTTGLTVAGSAFSFVARTSSSVVMRLPIVGPTFRGIGVAARWAGRGVGRFSMALLRTVLPFALVGGAAYLLYRHWDRLGEMVDTATGYVLTFSRRLADMVPRISAWVSGIDWQQMGRDIVEGLLSLFSNAGDAIEGDHSAAHEIAQNFGMFFRAVFDAAVEIIGGLARGLWDRTIEWIVEPADLTSQLQRAGAALGVTFGVALATPLRGPIFGALRLAFRGIFSGLGRLLPTLFRGGGGLARGLLSGGLRRIPYIGAVIGLLMDLPTIIEQFQTGDIEGAFFTTFRSITNGLLLGIPDLLEEFLGFDFITDIFEMIFEGSGIGGIARGIQDGDWADVLANALWFVFNTSFAGIPGLIRGLMSEIFGGDIVGAAISGFTDMLGNLYDIFLDIVDPMFSAWMVAWEEIRDIAEGIWEDTLVPLFEDLQVMWENFAVVAEEVWIDTIEPMIADMQEGFRAFIDWVSPYFLRAWNTIREGFGDFIDWVAPKVRWFGEMLLTVIGGAIGGLLIAIGYIAAAFVQAFFGAMLAIVTFRERWRQFKDYITNTMTIIGLQIRNFFLIPFLRAGDTILGIGETLSMAFNNLKTVFLDLLSTILTGIHGTLSGFGVIGRAAAGALSGPMENAALAATNQRIANDREERRIAALRRGRNEELVRSEQQVTDAIAQREVENARHQREVARQAAPVVASGRQANRAMRRFGDAATEGMESIGTSMAEFGTPAAQARADARTAARREAAHRERIAPAMQAIEAAGSRLTEAAREQLTSTMAQMADQGREITDEQVQNIVRTIEDLPAEVEGTGRRGQRAVAAREAAIEEAVAGAVLSLRGEAEEPVTEAPARRRGRQAAATATAATATTARTEREQARAAREQATQDETMRQVIISAFSAEAYGQLDRAMTVVIDGNRLRGSDTGGR